ncbi:Nmad2 family putative nucleotide modification protein [Hanstruepera flava]|uniref:Nmad2 family putative nucleotide modification protein n=1 Tax=Hanstruepera flava TaxID=2930218 RepID=UPI0020285E1D|nr:hypothetical protein [Hanstruepera flava]
MKLYSYCIPIDDGCAPNPFYGICTLNICKPVIRRTAKAGDWVVGVGSKNVKGKDLSGKLVYAMLVTKKMTMQQYHVYCKKYAPNKIPDIRHKHYKRRVGDCIYDFDKDPSGKLLPSVHAIENKNTDLGGVFTLLSNHFYYFGDKPVDIPQHLKGIINQGRGHKSKANDHLVQDFVLWIESQGYVKNHLYGKPQIKVEFKQAPDEEYNCAAIRCKSKK